MFVEFVRHHADDPEEFLKVMDALPVVGMGVSLDGVFFGVVDSISLDIDSDETEVTWIVFCRESW